MIRLLFTIIIFTSFSCTKKKNKEIKGSWKLLSGTLIEKGDTTVTDYTKNISFIKIINDDHFAFLSHNRPEANDTTKVFSAGGGTYTFDEKGYTEKLEYCNARDWEGHSFTFDVKIFNDTLIQQGIEKVGNVERLNIEKYTRIK